MVLVRRCVSVEVTRTVVVGWGELVLLGDDSGLLEGSTELLDVETATLLLDAG